MKLVRQRHELGCIPACIAMLMGVSYLEGVRLVHPRRHSGDRLSTTPERLRETLWRLGLGFREYSGARPLRRLHKPTIVVVDHPAFHPSLHGVVWDPKEGRILDPYPASCRNLKRHLPLTSYERSMYKCVVIEP